MIYTSYFAKLKKLPENYIPISIAAKSPTGYTGIKYTRLAPTYNILIQYKKDGNEEIYTRRYNTEILDKVKLVDVLKNIWNIIPTDQKKLFKEDFWKDSDMHVVLVCYEKPESFCHRHLIADWFKKNGIEVDEVK